MGISCFSRLKCCFYDDNDDDDDDRRSVTKCAQIIKESAVNNYACIAAGICGLLDTILFELK